MIQRIQTLYLLISAILGFTCLSMPLGRFYTAQGEHYADLYNLWIRLTDTGEHIFSPWALFALLVLSTTLTLLDILLYRHRAMQMRILTFCIILSVSFYAYFAFFAYMYKGDGTFTPSFTAALPFVCIVLDYLAFRGILKDEMLVRSLDRLR